MMLTLEIAPEVQRELARQAEVEGIAVPALVARLLEDAMGQWPAGTPPAGIALAPRDQDLA